MSHDIVPFLYFNYTKCTKKYIDDTLEEVDNKIIKVVSGYSREGCVKCIRNWMRIVFIIY